MNDFTQLPGTGTADDGDVSIAQLWSVVVRRRWLVLATTLVAVVAAGLIAGLTVPVYQSSASVRIDPQNSGVPVLDVLQKLGAGNAQEIFTEMEVLRSRRLAEAVVQRLQTQLVARTGYSTGKRRFVYFVMPPSPVNVSSFADSVTIVPGADGSSWRVHRTEAGALTLTRTAPEAPARELSARPGDLVDLGGASFRLTALAGQRPDFDLDVLGFESAVAQLRAGLSVTRAQRDANIVSVTYSSTDPMRARDVTNALAEAFLEFRNLGIKTEARSTAVFLREQLQLIQVQLNDAEERLRRFRESAQTVDLGAEATSQVAELAHLRADRDAKDGERAAIADLLDEAARRPAGATADTVSVYRRLVAFPTLFASPAATFLSQLNELENQRALLRQRRTADDPDVLTITGRIRDLEEQLRAIAVTYVQGLASQVSVMDSSIARFRSVVRLVPAKEMEFARISRETQVLTSLYTMLQTRLKESEIAQAIEDSRARIIDTALLPNRPVKPRIQLSLALGLMLGLAGGVGLAFARDSLDTAVHTREEMAGLTGAESIGLIPHLEPRAVATDVRRFLPALPRLLKAGGRGGVEARGRTVGDLGNRSAGMEAYRTLRTNLAFTNPDSPPRVIVFTSPFPRDGKSTTAANLAVVLAQQGRRVLLVDGDMRRGTLHQFFNDVPRAPGLSSILIGEATIGDCVAKVEMSDGSSVHLIPTGPLPPNPSELFGASRMDTFLAEVRATFDVVLFDSPPLNLVTDAAVLGAKVDGVVLVGRAGVTDRMALAYAADQLRSIRATLLGTVLNDFDPRRGYGYGYGYGYKSGYYHDQDEKKDG